MPRNDYSLAWFRKFVQVVLALTLFTGTFINCMSRKQLFSVYLNFVINTWPHFGTSYIFGPLLWTLQFSSFPFLLFTVLYLHFIYKDLPLLLWEREGGKIWENGTETCIISYKKQIASPGSMQDRGCVGLGQWDDPEGWYGERGGRGVQDWEHVCTHGRFMLMYGKTNAIL